MKNNDKENTKKEVAEKVIDVLEEVKEAKENTKKQTNKRKDLNYKSRGFTSIDEAYNFPNTEQFKKLGEADKNEYMAWLNK